MFSKKKKKMNWDSIPYILLLYKEPIQNVFTSQ